MTKNKKIEFWVLILWNILAYILSYFYGNNYLAIALFFFLPPLIYLSFRKPEMVKKISCVSVILLVPIVTIVGYLGYTDESWYNFGVSGIMLFHTYPVEDFLWAFLYGYYILAVYEYFFERERILRTPKKFLSFETTALAISLLFCLFIYYRGEPLVIPYFYIIFIGVFAFLLPGIIFMLHPRIFKKALYAELFFLPLSFLCEHITNIKGGWVFPGHHFIGQVQLLGAILPFEELLWLFLIVPAIIAYYEFFADDDK